MFAIAAAALLHGSSASNLQSVPAVGCTSDGQVGPLPAPSPHHAPRLPSDAARLLAYYTSENGPDVLAPRGWHCIGIYGSDGSILIVTPELHKAEEFFTEKPPRIKGPAVISSFSYGGTSGRFAEWGAIARYFPKYAHVINRQEWQELSGEQLPRGPFSRDVIVTRSDRAIRLVTPAGRDGQGTSGYLAKSAVAIHSMRHLAGSGDETSLLAVDVRLGRAEGRFIDVILDNLGGNQ